MNTASDAWDTWDAVSRLPEREREVCRMVAENYTQGEIAGRIGVCQRTVGRILFRLRGIFHA